MPTNAELATRGVQPATAERNDTPIAVDTSVAVAFLDASHTAHRACVEALAGRTRALAGHAAFETLSVLTRLPGPTAVAPADALIALRAAFPDPCWLSPDQHAALLATVGNTGISGGSVYDALVAEAARVNERMLLTRDRRAVSTYEFLGVSYELIG